MDELTLIFQIKDLPLGGSTTCRRESFEPLPTMYLLMADIANQTKSYHLSKELDYTTLCNSFIILICLLLFCALFGYGKLCYSSLVLFDI